MIRKICKICKSFREPYNYLKSLSGFLCKKCKQEQTELNLSANTYNIKKLIERLESMEKAIEDKKYEIVIDIQPLANQLRVSKQHCAELIADEFMRIVFPINELKG